ncbi:MAG: hypothetical protein ACE5FF_14135 [Saprospiraceae bacterium]
MKKRWSFLLLVLAIASTGFFLFKKIHPAPGHTLFDAVYDDQPVQLTVETDLAALFEKKAGDGYLPAVFTFQKTACPVLCLDGKVKARGVFRKATCSFPPLKLRVEDEVLRKQGLKERKTLKLVTHCDSDPAFDQLVYKEYLAFKIYSLLTERSFRVQLANVRYVDAKKELADIERPGFLIENDNELADRLGGRIWKEDYGPVKGVDKEQYKLFTVFQFMVGNTDWNVSGQHNAVVIVPKKKNAGVRMPFPVPYDFDFCGLVDAPYAVPHYSIPIEDVRERFFQWRGKQDEDFSEVFALFAKNKAAILKMCREFEPLRMKNAGPMPMPTSRIFSKC